MDCLNSIAPTDEELISFALDDEALPQKPTTISSSVKPARKDLPDTNKPIHTCYHTSIAASAHLARN